MRDITLEETAYFNFTTRSFSTGVPTVLAGTPALSVLESNNVTPITAGVSVSVDRASVVGLNQATVVATAANGYEAGKSYAVYISTGTVGGVSVVGEVVAQFTVQAAAAFTRLGAPAGASVSADVAAVKVDTAAIKTKTDFLPSATAGSAGGVFIAGTNASLTITGVTTFTGATVHTGNVSMAAGLTITQSVLNTSALAITGNGSGHGMITAGGTTGSGLVAQGNGSGRGGMEVYGVVGPGLYLEGGSGVDGHGILVQGGTNGDGLKAVGAGTGVPIRGNITGNITGTITTATNVTTVNGLAANVITAASIAADAITDAKVAADVTIASVTGAVGSVTGNVGGNVVGSVGSLTTNNDKTGYALSATGSAAFTEGYRADGATGTLPQLLYEVIAHLGESSIAGTTKTVKKIDGITTAAVYTLDSATTPTSISRTT